MCKANLTFKEFKDNLKIILSNKPSHMRKGQTLMNYLATVWMEEYKRISSVHYYDETNIDCFFNDNLFDNTLNHLEKVWRV